jgi:RHS repeat-associated protein
MFSLAPRRFHSLLIAPALLPLFMLVSPKVSTNDPPVIINDSYTIHGCAIPLTPDVTANDSDPDGDQILIVGFRQRPAHGSISRGPFNTVSYCPDYAYTGSDSFTYDLCGGPDPCIGTVSLNVVNQPPTGGTDSYNVHRATVLGPFLVNDSDPDGESVSCGDVAHECILTFPQHGGLSGVGQSDKKSYGPNYGYTGPDSFTYNACDGLGLCTPTTVNISVDNNAPDAVDDAYTVPASSTTIGPFLENDSDPDGDAFGMGGPFQESIVSFPHHGSLSGIAQPDKKIYSPNEGYSGIDSFVYAACDELGKCSMATVTLDVNPAPSPTPTPTPTPTPIPNDDDNLGQSCPNQLVGRPVNVTNGNMYLQQTDYTLAGVGEVISFTRTYNSMASRSGLFGSRWSTGYDEALVINSPTSLRLYMPDGRATDFVGDGSGSFVPVQTDFFGQINHNADGTFSLSFKDGRVHVFAAFGALLSLSDRNSDQTRLTYDGSGKLTSVTDPSGRSVSVTTETNGRILSISDTMGTIGTYAYGAGNELLSVVYADNSGFQFNYDGNSRLTSVNDVLGNVLESHEYDSQGRALTSEKQGGVEHYSLNYVSDSETDVTDALGHITKYFFDKSTSRNVVTRIEGLCSCGSGSQSQTWAYDNNLNILSHSNSLNQTTTYTYDSQGNQLTMTDSAGATTTTYNQFGQPLAATDAMGSTTVFTYNGQGNPISITDPLSKVTTFTSNSRGQLLTITDARGKTTSSAYDANGNLITQTDALGHATQFAYDQRGRLTSATNALGHATAFAYDGVGRVSQVTQADGTVISYEYDLAGRRTAMTDAKGNRTSYNYDGAYRLKSETDALNQTTVYDYDLMSKLVARTDALSRTTNFDYDDFNRLVKITYPQAMVGAARLFETLAYDAAGNVTQRTDSAGRVTSSVYDDLNRVVSTTDADNKTTTFEYDALSRMTALVDARSQRYRFNYDSLGRLRHVRRGAIVMTFTYDAVGNRKHRTDYNGATTVYDYDALNRLKTINYPDTTTVTYTYDKLSRLQTATNENGTIDFDYNKMNRLTNVTDGFGQVVDYNYDPNGNRTKLSLNAATVATYRYDAVNRLTKILDAAGAAFTFDYDATNKLTQKKAPNSVKTSYQYDGLDRLTRLTDTKGVATVKDRQYQYNATSQLTQITEPAITRSYAYDSTDRLTSASYTNPTQPAESYAYDSVGNRTSSQLSASYGYQPFNRLTNTATASYSYDTNGNLISKTDSGGTTQYVWDFESRLKQVTLPNGRTVAYRYDALGRRIQRTPSTGIGTNFIYDGQDVIKDRNSDGSTVDYLNGPGIDNKLRLTDSRLAAAGPLYFLQDHLGSTTALTNSQGVAVSQINYDSFGNPSAGANLTRYTYTGREFDSDTGLYYYRARWYDPKVGRFISEDPIGMAGGINQFAYVGNNPQNGKDPSGLYNEDVHYYLTYFIATKFSCVTKDEARLIADADQSTDEISDTQPFLGWTVAQALRNGYNHAFTQYVNSRSNDLRSAAQSTTHNYVGVGRYLHFLQDTFSHRGFSNSVIGQFGFNGVDLPFFGGFVVDHTNHEIEKSEEMARTTFYALLEWAKRKDCKCQFSDIGSWWPQVTEFLKASNGDPEKKRRILNVPRR